jgi:hypothetical protein
MEYRYALGGAVDPLEHQAMPMGVEIGGRAETLDQGDGVGVCFGALEPRLVDQKCRNDSVDPGVVCPIAS